MQFTDINRLMAFDKVMAAGFLLLISFTVMAQDQAIFQPRSESAPIISFQLNGHDQGSEAILAYQQSHGDLLWERIIRGSDHLLLGPVELTRDYVVVTALYMGEVDFGRCHFSAGGRLGALYAIYDLRGRLLVAGNLQGDDNVTAIEFHLGSTGSVLTAEFAGVQFILPLAEPEATRNSASTYLVDSPSRGSRNLHIEQVRLDWIEEPLIDLQNGTDIFITETGSSTDDPDGDPPPQPSSSGS